MAKLNILEALTKATQHIVNYISEVDAKTRTWVEKRIKIDETELDKTLENLLSDGINITIDARSYCMGCTLNISYADVAGDEITRTDNIINSEFETTIIELRNINSGITLQHGHGGLKVVLNNEVLYNEESVTESSYTVPFEKLSNGCVLEVDTYYY